MNAPLRVEIVRPQQDRAESVGRAIAIVAEGFGSAFLLMLLIPIFASWHPGYAQSLALIAALRVGWQPYRSLDLWSRKASKSHD